MAGITLWWLSGSAPARRVHVVLEEKKLAYTSKLLEISKGQFKSPEHLAVNPRGQVPVLVDGDRTVCESIAAMLYLEDAYPDVKLLPADLDTRAKVLQRLLEADVLLKSGVNAFRWKLFNMIKSEADEATYIQECKKLKPELDRWEAYLTSQFLVGDTFTLADAAVGTALGQFKRCGLDFSKWPKLKSYLETVEARPSFVATFPPHWKETPDNTSLAPVTQE